MMIEFGCMYDIGHGFIRLGVYVDGRPMWLVCLAHNFPNVEKGIPWLREQFASGKVKLGLHGWAVG